MGLSAAQLTTLKADVAANTATVGGVQIKNLPNNPDANFAIAAWYNQAAAGPFVVWRDLPMETVLDTIAFANMTPADAVPANPDLAVQVWIARSLSCQGKQFNLQNLINGRSTASMKKTNYRAALQDALTNLPAGASGALVAANWVGVRDGAKFNATNAEKLFATGTGTTASPADLSFEGSLTGADVENARNS